MVILFMYRLTIKWTSAIITTMQKGAAVKVTAKPVKLLNPRSGDTQVMGTEPTWEVQPTDNRISRMSKAFGWYNYFYGKKRCSGHDRVLSRSTGSQR
jgi:hypothetical protein